MRQASDFITPHWSRNTYFATLNSYLTKLKWCLASLKWLDWMCISHFMYLYLHTINICIHINIIIVWHDTMGHVYAQYYTKMIFMSIQMFMVCKKWVLIFTIRIHTIIVWLVYMYDTLRNRHQRTSTLRTRLHVWSKIPKKIPSIWT